MSNIFRAERELLENVVRVFALFLKQVGSFNVIKKVKFPDSLFLTLTR